MYGINSTAMAFKIVLDKHISAVKVGPGSDDTIDGIKPDGIY